MFPLGPRTPSVPSRSVQAPTETVLNIKVLFRGVLSSIIKAGYFMRIFPLAVKTRYFPRIGARPRGTPYRCETTKPFESPPPSELNASSGRKERLFVVHGRPVLFRKNVLPALAFYRWPVHNFKAAGSPRRSRNDAAPRRTSVHLCLH